MIDPQDLHDAAWERLSALAEPGVFTTYDTTVPENPPVDEKGRVRQYAVLFASPGILYASGMDAAQGSRDSTFQVTCAGGTPDYVFWAVNRVQSGLPGVVTIGGRQHLILARVDFDPGGPIEDQTKTDRPRFYIPLEFRLHVP